MSKSMTRQVRREIEDTLKDVATALRKAAEHLGDDGEKVVAEAAIAMRKAADDLAKAVGPDAKAIAAKAAQEVKDHPIASAAAALTAAAALISLLSSKRHKVTA